jgi:peroxiredoxin
MRAGIATVAGMAGAGAGATRGEEPPIAREQRPAKFNKRLKINGPAPDFVDLAAADGSRYSLKSFADATILVIVFTSRKCPVSQAYQTRFTELWAEFETHGLQMVAISVATGANEQLDKVREELKVHPRPYPWLHDPTQQVGRDFGAYVTPQVFVLDAQRRVVYMGAFDDHHDRREVVKHYVLDAVDAILRNRPVLVPESLPKGCEIEYAGEPRSKEE